MLIQSSSVLASATVDELGAIWDDFARTQCAAYSPIYERICAGVARDLEILDLVREAPPEAHVPNVLLATVRFLLLGGTDHPLASIYAGRRDDDPFPEFRDFVLAHRERVLTVLEHRRTQTNEIGRCAVLAPALAEVQRRTLRPLALLDVGASAGLNLRLDAYRLDYGSLAIGPEGAPTVTCTVHGSRPPVLGVELDLAWRLGLDRSPVDVTSGDERRWLEACVWPDQPERAARLRDALDLATADPPALVTGDAVDDLHAAAAGAPKGAELVVVTSWAAAYLDRARRRAFVQAIADLGRTTHWVAGEGVGTVLDLEPGEPPDHPGIAPNVLSLQRFEDATPHPPELLAWVHPHGAWLDWRAVDADPTAEH